MTKNHPSMGFQNHVFLVSTKSKKLRIPKNWTIGPRGYFDHKIPVFFVDVPERNIGEYLNLVFRE